MSEVLLDVRNLKKYFLQDIQMLKLKKLILLK